MSIAYLCRYDAATAAEELEILRAVIGEPIVMGPPHGDLDEAALAAVEIAVVANPAPGILARMPGLGLIQSLWAGVDGLLADRTIPPAVPLARLVDPLLATAMAEAVVAHVMALHRQLPAYREQQAVRRWQRLAQPFAAECPVGILGLGEMGRAAIDLLRPLGFPILGWSRSAGADALARLQAEARIVVNLLPLTAETCHILAAPFLSRLRAGAALINFGRGGHQVVPDILAALDAGRLSHAVLDVFETEPLPDDSPLWRHPKVTVTPHVAAETDAVSAARCTAANIAAFRAGRPVAGLVDRAKGY
ncbi:2-hydroxyacid dehydrogenase [Zavarzinia compransoris]|uniref:Glyoxylate/hydroxypyruvate reductase A n=1 Tax=Zavarzinia compransoris TaxID=1264899 RepID=A0A317E5J4_9PROT|nr:glyoxylate/hydroxypyruvate reductase A [Zavarzinia compransoris]PWR21941.1 glyoxylate/hydroxypyruvate reductase A [Zavarzinia compransoris]TDP47322.1 glyoxylate/hydroxypyruvate reductase A [Zavarzinia compransoris]